MRFPELETPIILGSCDLFVNEANIRKHYTKCVGAIVLKSATREPTSGYPQPHVALLNGGVLVASGMANPGIAEMCRLAKSLSDDIPIIGSVADPALAREFARTGVKAVELNLSCPHNPGGVVPAHCPETVSEAVEAARLGCHLPIFAKLTGWDCDIVETSKAAIYAGADAVVVSNLFPGTGYYTGLVKQTSEYRIGDCLVGHGHGGYTSRNFLAGVLFMIRRIKEKLNIPIIATGGCCADADALAQTYLSGVDAIETVSPLYLGQNLDMIYDEFIEWKEKNDI